MITIVSYIALRYFFGSDWTGMLLILPVFLDFALIEWVGKL